MTRMVELRTRRHVLLARCAAQRLDLAQRVAQLRAGLPRWAQTDAAGHADRGAPRARRHPLAWIAVLAGLTLVGRTREVLTLVQFMRSAVLFATRAALLVRLIGHLRASRTRGTQ